MNKNLVVVDIEADGPYPGGYSMVCFGAVLVRDQAITHYSGLIQPISDQFIPASLAVSGFTREQHAAAAISPRHAMAFFRTWLREYCGDERSIFVSDNPAWDFQWINYYFHRFLGENPFGWSGRRIGDLYAGITGEYSKPWKHLRDTPHTHNPVDDAKGNAEALVKMFEMMKEKK